MWVHGVPFILTFKRSTFCTYLSLVMHKLPSWRWIGDDDLSQQKLKAVLGSVTTGWYPVVFFFYLDDSDV